MNRHAKGSPAGSIERRGNGLGRIFRAFAPRGASIDATGTGAPSHRGRLTLTAIAVTAFLAIPASQASAEIVVNLAGPGAGAVTSSPAGINCSNVGGAPGPSCSSEFPNFTILQMSAAPGPGFNFSDWKADDPFAFFFASKSCNSGSENPCEVANLTGSTVHVTATFGCVPPVLAPDAATGGASAGLDPLSSTLSGTVSPNGCGLEEAYFEYGTTTEYGSTTETEPEPAGLGNGSTAVPVTAETDFLEPESTYHYRLVAVGPGGTSKGEDQIFTTGATPGDECPNALLRAEQGARAQHLPGCMALEMASPPNKGGYRVQEPNVSADGSRVSFFGNPALGKDPAGLPNNGAVYVASREESGWTSESTVPHASPRIGYFWELTTLRRPSFTPDFSRWFVVGATESLGQQGIMSAYEGGVDGFVRLLSEPLYPFSGAGDQEVVTGTTFVGASADHSHLFFRPSKGATYFAGDPSGVQGRNNVYLARATPGGERALELLNRDRTGKVWGGGCPVRLGGSRPLGGGTEKQNGERNQGAVSPDGSRVYFSTPASQPQGQGCNEEANKLRILERLETPSGPTIAPLFVAECTRSALPDPPGACKELSGDDLYQGASLNQTKVYFTTNRELASTDVDGSNAECSVQTAVSGCDLYLYDLARDAGHRLVQVSAGENVPGEHEAGNDAKVFNGITAISADGSHVYYVATGVLTADANPENDTAQASKPNLYLWDAETEQTSFVATLAAPTGPSDPGDQNGSLDVAGLWGGEGTWRNNAYPVPVLSPGEETGARADEGGDGHILVFESKAELTANDADGRHRDVYRYDAAAGTLDCVSCLPGSTSVKPDEAPFDVADRGDVNPLGTDFAEYGRWASEDGQVIGFMTAQRLLPGDVNRATDGYFSWHGSLARLPGTPFAGFPKGDGPYLSHDGSTLAFATQTQLLPQDGDNAADVYVARVDGGFPGPRPPQLCQGEECRGEPSAAPQLSGAGTAVLQGDGNVKPEQLCKRGRVRRHGKCVKKPRRRGHHKPRQNRTAQQAGRTH